MTKANRRYFIVLALCFIGLITIHYLSPKPINWLPSYSKNDKIPYGTSALRSALPLLFPGQAVRDESLPLYNSLQADNARARGNYIVINNDFHLDTLDLHTLLRYINRGNNAFVAAQDFDGAFGDSLKLETAAGFYPGHIAGVDSATLAALRDGTNGLPVINFSSPSLHSDTGYVYMNCFRNTYFSRFDTLKAKVLGTNGDGQVNFISMQFGRGKLYISSVPDAFCNYHFVKERNDAYAIKALSYLPDAPITWDEYYKVNNKPEDSPLRVIFSKPALAMAYYVLMLSLLIFILIGIKRRQRIIPVIEPMRNTTLQFVDVVGALYYKSGNHKNIAEKKITYFLEYIRSHFQLQTNLFDEEFYKRVISLSGIEAEKIHTLFNYFALLQLKTTVTQEELLRLNALIEEFYTLNKR